MRRLGFAVHGFDLQEEVVNQLRTTHGIPATAGELTNLGNFFASSSFDLITAYHVVEHVSDVQRVLSVIWNLLRPGGWFAGAVPLLDSNQARWFGKHWAGVQEAPRHLSLPSKLGMTACCQLVGFEGVHFRPDSSLNCAGVVGASLFPGASLTRVYARGTLVPLLLRFLGGMATAISLPWCWIENRMSNSMALGIVFGRKPS
jgi:SAM-dependent methyltransferase